MAEGDASTTPSPDPTPEVVEPASGGEAPAISDAGAPGGGDVLPSANPSQVPTPTPQVTAGGVGVMPRDASVPGDSQTPVGDGSTVVPSADSGLPGVDPTPSDGPAAVDADAGASGDTDAVEPMRMDGLLLAVAFDKAASMGYGGTPYYDAALKWDPVVAGLTAFFSAADSAGLSSSLTFFPNDEAPSVGNSGSSSTAFCDPADYQVPEVGVTALPSSAFGDALQAAKPPSDQAWLVGTPTLAVVSGTLEFLRGVDASASPGRRALVLITDGPPKHCDDSVNDVGLVADEASKFAAEIPTYVIGIGNPVTDSEPNPPDTISELQRVAEAGGTENMYVIDTSDPNQTPQLVVDALNAIRRHASR